MTVVKIRAKKEIPEQVAPVTAGNENRPPAPVTALEANPPLAKPRIVVALALALRTLLPPLLGFAVFLALWAIIAQKSGLPDPGKTWNSAIKLFSDPFYRNGPNDQGIGWNVLMSLGRVGVGFGLAALIGIPFGFLIGRFAFLSRMSAPIISLLRPVSPLAWLPIGLYVFKEAQPAAIWVIFISSIWPMIETNSPWRMARSISRSATNLPFLVANTFWTFSSDT